MGKENLRSAEDMAGERDIRPALASLQLQPQQLLLHNHNNRSGSDSAPGTSLAKLDNVDEFPCGMQILVVDDDPICLMVLERMLCRCSYRVVKCASTIDALSLLRGDNHAFDLVLTDVYMPDMDGFKLLELVGLDMPDLPVVMMSRNGEKSAVMKGITGGACDYLLKPLRIEELRNIWQHVVRRKQLLKVVSQTKSVDIEGGGCEIEKRGAAGDDADPTPSATDTTDGNLDLLAKFKEMHIASL